MAADRVNDVIKERKLSWAEIVNLQSIRLRLLAQVRACPLSLCGGE